MARFVLGNFQRFGEAGTSVALPSKAAVLDWGWGGDKIPQGPQDILGGPKVKIAQTGGHGMRLRGHRRK